MSLTGEDVRRIAEEVFDRKAEKLLRYIQQAFQLVATPAVAVTLEQIKQAFPEDLRQHLTVTTQTIKCEYVSTDKFAKISAIAEGLGFKRIVDGKNSRWQR